MVGCTHLMCTATLSSQCLYCYMVISDSLVSMDSVIMLAIMISWINVALMPGPMAVIHYFLSPLLVAHGFIPVLLSNLLFMVGASYYHYLNFLGYDGKALSHSLSLFFLLHSLLIILEELSSKFVVSQLLCVLHSCYRMLFKFDVQELLARWRFSWIDVF